MINFWISLNKQKVENLSKQLVKFNRKHSFNAIENNHYNHIRDIFLTLISTETLNEPINILDYGSNILTISNLQNKINCKKVKFDIYDPFFKKGIYNYSHIKYVKFKIINRFNKITKNKYLIVNFGSSIQYEKDIFNKLSLLNFRKTKYIVITSTPLSFKKKYESKQSGKKNVTQYIHSFHKIINFFKKRNFKLVFKSRNNRKNIACDKVKFKTHSLNIILRNAK